MGILIDGTALKEPCLIICTF